MKAHHLILVMSALAWTSPLLADCPAFPALSVEPDMPDSGVPMNGRVLVWSHFNRACGDMPQSEFRLVDASGAPVGEDIALVLDRGHGQLRWLELTPRGVPGDGETLRVEVKKPIDEATLGDWELLTEVRFEGAQDTSAPQLSGTLEGRVGVETATLSLSPCHVEESEVVRTTLKLPAVWDDRVDADALVYIVERRAPDADWQAYERVFPRGDEVSWHDGWGGWGEIWSYRVRVRDRSGNESVTNVVTLEAPVKAAP